MAKKPIDRISLNFYEDVNDDKILIEYFNSKYNKKFRGQKIKEILVKYLKTNGELEDFKHEIKNNNNIQQDKENKKKKFLKGLETY